MHFHEILYGLFESENYTYNLNIYTLGRIKLRPFKNALEMHVLTYICIN